MATEIKESAWVTDYRGMLMPTSAEEQVIKDALAFYSKETGLDWGFHDFRIINSYPQSKYYISKKPLSAADYKKIIDKHIEYRGAQLTGGDYNPSESKDDVFIYLNLQQGKNLEFFFLKGVPKNYSTQHFFSYRNGMAKFAEGGEVDAFEKGGAIAEKVSESEKSEILSELKKMYKEKSAPASDRGFGNKAFIAQPHFMESSKKHFKKYEDTMERTIGGRIVLINEHKPISMTKDYQVVYCIGKKVKPFEKGGSVDGFDVDEVLKHYMVAALWSSNDSDNEDQPFDRDYSTFDIDPATVESMKMDVVKFLTENKAALKESELSDDQIGHDFWLSRNGHGAGFFDHSLDPDIEKKLMNAAKAFKECNLYAEDGKVKVDPINQIEKTDKKPSAGFNAHSDEWFDELVEYVQSEKAMDANFPKLVELAKKEATKENLEKFMEIMEGCSCSKPALKDKILSHLRNIRKNEYKNEFKYQYGGKAKKAGKVSAASSFFDLFLQAVEYPKMEKGGAIDYSHRITLSLKKDSDTGKAIGYDVTLWIKKEGFEGGESRWNIQSLKSPLTIPAKNEKVAYESACEILSKEHGIKIDPDYSKGSTFEKGGDIASVVGKTFRPFTSEKPEYFVTVEKIDFDNVTIKHVDGEVKKLKTKDFFEAYIEVAGKKEVPKPKTIEEVTDIMPEVVAESVANRVLLEKYNWLKNPPERYAFEKKVVADDVIEEEIEWWVKYLVARAEHLFQVNKAFRKQIEQEGNAGRDALKMWMFHWIGVQDERVLGVQHATSSGDKSKYAHKASAKQWLDSLEKHKGEKFEKGGEVAVEESESADPTIGKRCVIIASDAQWSREDKDWGRFGTVVSAGLGQMHYEVKLDEDKSSVFAQGLSLLKGNKPKSFERTRFAIVGQVVRCYDKETSGEFIGILKSINDDGTVSVEEDVTRTPVRKGKATRMLNHIDPKLITLYRNSYGEGDMNKLVYKFEKGGEIDKTEAVIKKYAGSGLNEKEAITLDVAYQMSKEGKAPVGFKIADVKKVMPKLLKDKLIHEPTLQHTGVIELTEKGKMLALKHEMKTDFDDANKEFWGQFHVGQPIHSRMFGQLTVEEILPAGLLAKKEGEHKQKILISKEDICLDCDKFEHGGDVDVKMVKAKVIGGRGEEAEFTVPIDAYDFLPQDGNDKILTYFDPNQAKDADDYDFLEMKKFDFDIKEVWQENHEGKMVEVFNIDKYAKGGEIKPKTIHATYNEYGYTIWDSNGREKYAAGNNPDSSDVQDTLPLDHEKVVPLEKIKHYAEVTGKEIAAEEGLKFTGAQYEKREEEFANGGSVGDAQQDRNCVILAKGAWKGHFGVVHYVDKNDRFMIIVDDHKVPMPFDKLEFAMVGDEVTFGGNNHYSKGVILSLNGQEVEVFVAGGARIWMPAIWLKEVVGERAELLKSLEAGKIK